MHVAIDNVASACGLSDIPSIDILLLLISDDDVLDLSPPLTITADGLLLLMADCDDDGERLLLLLSIKASPNDTPTREPPASIPPPLRPVRVICRCGDSSALVLRVFIDDV